MSDAVIQRWAVAIVVAVVAFLGSGCDRGTTIDTSLATAPALPTEMQGVWRFDRERTLSAWKSTLPPEVYEQQMQFVALIDEAGQRIHSDVRVAGASIVGQDDGGGLEPQYDFTEWGRHEGLLRGNVWWHGDRRDAESRVEQTLTLRLDEGVLWIGFGDGSERTLWYLFNRGE